MNTTLRIGKYDKGNPTQGLLLFRNKKDILIAYCDAD